MFVYMIITCNLMYSIDWFVLSGFIVYSLVVVVLIQGVVRACGSIVSSVWFVGSGPVPDESFISLGRDRVEEDDIVMDVKGTIVRKVCGRFRVKL